MTFTFGSICSGIECASVAVEPLGWQPAFFAEIEKFPSAVLAHHYPEVKNLGDFTKITPDQHRPIDALVGGTPCQDFSIAGLRAGMAGERGNLSLDYILLAQRERARWVAWENVPGVLSSNGGGDFQAFLSGLAGWEIPIPAGGWQNSGIANAAPTTGSYGLAWRVLDAQFVRTHGLERAVPQRRRRVIVVGYIGDWRGPAAVLFERESMRGDSPPRREAGKRIAPTLAARTEGGGGLGTDFDTGGGLSSAVAHTVKADNKGHRHDPSADTFVPEVAWTLQERDAKGADSNTKDGHLIVEPVAHSFRADGFDASEDGSGRGTPMVAFMPARTLAEDGEVDSRYAERDVCDAVHTSTGSGNKAPLIAFDCKAGANTGFAVGDVPGALRGEGHGGGHAAIAFSCKDHGADARTESAPTLRAMGHNESHANAGGQIAVAIQERAICENPEAGPDGVGVRTDGAAYTLEARNTPQAVAFQTRIARNGRGYDEEVCPALNGADAGATSDMRPCVAFPDASQWRVRRLTPRECERLMGLKDDYTLIPGKPRSLSPEEREEMIFYYRASGYTLEEAERYAGAPDGPRYKALGNGFAINMFRWVATRIDAVEAMLCR